MIAFGTGGWREIIGDGFTRENIIRIAYALAERMKKEGCEKEGICLGYDRRFLSREAAFWFAEAVAAHGIPVRFVNLSAPTPQIMFCVKHLNVPYGAAVTASHNPAVYNGIKIFTRGGRDADITVTDALSAAANAVRAADVPVLAFEKALEKGIIRFIDPRDDYLDSIIARINMDAIRKRRPRVVLDPMYGVSLTGMMTILYTARCDVDVINDRHDAFFGGHLPAPDPDTLRDLQQSVADHHADLGIATDGDADRLGVIDENGRYVNANEVLVLLYHYLLKYKGWKGDAVRNLATTHILDKVAEKFGQVCHEVPVGFKHISAAMDQYDALLGGESSGGLTVRGHISGKDGLYAASLLVEMLCVTGRKLSELVKEVYNEYGECHMAQYDWALTPERKEYLFRKIMQDHDLPDFGREQKKVSYLDGCKVYFEGAWIILRFSGTEPRVRVFSEADTAENAGELVRIMAEHTGLPF